MTLNKKMRLDYELLRLPETSIFKWGGYIFLVNSWIDSVEIYEQLILSLRQVNRAVDLHSKQLNKRFGLTGPQLLVIKKIVELKGPMAKMVAEAVNLSPATVTTIIDRLEVNKLVQRKRSDYDKRRVELFVTDKGKNLLLQVPQLLPTTFITQFQALGAWEQNQLLSSVQRIVEMMESESDAIPSALMLS